jgi:hypothetical protein
MAVELSSMGHIFQGHSDSGDPGPVDLGASELRRQHTLRLSPITHAKLSPTTR